jgi:hypothetical protein
VICETLIHRLEKRERKRLPGQHPADDGGPYVIFILIDSQMNKKRDGKVLISQRDAKKVMR